MSHSTTTSYSLPDYWRWFHESRFGLFIHFGPYAVLGRGEQVLFRERLDQRAYAEMACDWQPTECDPVKWAEIARQAGAKYAVFTTRHHDGYCMWDSQLTDYTSAKQAAQRDFVCEYVDAFRTAGLRIGLYYSLADFRIPAYWNGPQVDPQGWESFVTYVHGQVRELLTQYGQIDELWFDGSWPHNAQEWRSFELVEMIRSLQPRILINNRLGEVDVEDAADEAADGGNGAGGSRTLGDFGTPEHQITAEQGRPWESCQVSTWRLWGFARGERWRPADYLLDMLVEAASKGGNLLLNVGPDAEGRFPDEFVTHAQQIGEWLTIHGEAIYDSEPGDVCEFVTYGWQIRKGNNLYLVIRFWDGRETLMLAGLETHVRKATLLTTGQVLACVQNEDYLTLTGLPAQSPTPLFPVIKLECVAPPRPRPWAKERLWSGDPHRMSAWAAARGVSVYADGEPR